MSTRSTPRRSSWAEPAKAHRECAAMKDRRLSMAPISAISTATSLPPFASGRRPDGQLVAVAAVAAVAEIDEVEGDRGNAVHPQRVDAGAEYFAITAGAHADPDFAV